MGLKLFANPAALRYPTRDAEIITYQPAGVH